MGIAATREQIDDWVRKGLIPPDQLAAPIPLATTEGGPLGRPKRSAKPSPESLVAPSFTPPATWTIPLVLPSLANDRDWRQRNRVTQAHRRAVSRALAPQLAALVPFAHAYHHAGRPILCRLTRLGGRRLDRTVNVPMSLKYVEDAVCLMLGIDDASDRWQCECEQEPGGPTGVRIEIQIG